MRAVNCQHREHCWIIWSLWWHHLELRAEVRGRRRSRTASLQQEDTRTHKWRETRDDGNGRWRSLQSKNTTDSCVKTSDSAGRVRKEHCFYFHLGGHWSMILSAIKWSALVLWSIFKVFVTDWRKKKEIGQGLSWGLKWNLHLTVVVYSTAEENSIFW